MGSTPKDAAVREGKGKEQPSGGSEKSTTSSVASEELIALGARKRKAPGRSVGSGDLFEKAQVSMFVKVVLLEQECQHGPLGVLLGYPVHGISESLVKAVNIFTIDCGPRVGLYALLVYIPDPHIRSRYRAHSSCIVPGGC